MVRMLLNRRTIRVCQYWTYRRDQEGTFPGLGLIDEDVGLLRGVNCDILAQGLIGLIEYSYHQGIPSFSEAHL
jgi:hypothetical protein